MSSKRWEIATPKNGTEGLMADEWEIHPSGALIFWDSERLPREFVVAYAHGQWVTFWQLDE